MPAGPRHRDGGTKSLHRLPCPVLGIGPQVPVRVEGFANAGVPHAYLDRLRVQPTPVTGGGLVKRRLYSDSDVAVLNVRRANILTGIDIGGYKCGVHVVHAKRQPMPEASAFRRSYMRCPFWDRGDMGLASTIKALLERTRH